jgi:hypothetical protein
MVGAIACVIRLFAKGYAKTQKIQTTKKILMVETTAKSPFNYLQ